MKMVYVVDSDPVMRESLDMLLQIEGFSVQTFASARRFLTMAPPRRAGCVLTEIYMPDDVSGLDVVSEVSRWGPDWSSIILTVDYDMDLREVALALGARDFLEKPCLPDELVAALRKVFDVAPCAVAPALPHPRALEGRDRAASTGLAVNKLAAVWRRNSI